MTESTTNIAIACQGGGSHTAFTAGVLKKLLGEWDDNHELVGISGTSGGAFNALAAWYGLVSEDEQKAISLLNSIWEDLAAKSVTDKMINDWVGAINRMHSSGMAIPQFSPYQLPGSELGKERIRSVLERYIEFGAVPEYCDATAPDLVVGTVNIDAGVFETFVNEAVSVDAVLASAAVPNMFEAVEINDHYHWDGLFSQNPPVSDLMHQPAERKPDELWVIQINPQKRENEPKTLEEIADRRNELSGNISLNQELRFIEKVNGWVEAGKLPADEFSKTSIRRIVMDDGYHCSTKTDRDPEFIQELMDLGETRATEFLEQWQS